MSLQGIPLGRYTATIDRVEFGQSARKGTPYVRVFVVIPEYPNESVSADIWLTEKAIGIARARLKKCGYDPDKGSLRDLCGHPEQLRGNEVDVEVCEEEWNGALRKKLEIPTGNPPPPLETLDAFDKALRDVKKGGDDPPPGEGFTSDIPFLWLLPFVLPLLAV